MVIAAIHSHCDEHTLHFITSLGWDGSLVFSLVVLYRDGVRGAGGFGSLSRSYTLRHTIEHHEDWVP